MCNKIEIMDINYDFVPTIPNGYKSLWVTARLEVPWQLHIGSVVYVISDSIVMPASRFKVQDIIGKRIVLIPTAEKRAVPAQSIFRQPFLTHASSKDGGWKPSHHDFHWGYGSIAKAPMGVLVIV